MSKRELVEAVLDIQTRWRAEFGGCAHRLEHAGWNEEDIFCPALPSVAVPDLPPWRLVKLADSLPRLHDDLQQQNIATDAAMASKARGLRGLLL